MNLSTMNYLGIGFVFLLVVALAMLSAKKAGKGAFGGARSSGSFVIMGALIGTLVGGSSTIGTAQLAYSYGFSAWWFTLGGGIGVVLLGLLFKKNFYARGFNTLPELIGSEYGRTNAGIVTVLNSLGTFLSIVAQIISATALITAVTSINALSGILISLVLVMVYVLFGGALSLGYAGTLKTVLLSVSILVCGALAIGQAGGVQTFAGALEAGRYFSLIARGASVDLGAGLSLIVGVLTTQSYISAIVMAKNEQEITKATIITAILVPLIGVAGIFVGMYMKTHYPAIDSKMALPLFILYEMPDVIAGVMLGTLLLAVIGTAAGLSFGMAKMYYKNFLEKRRAGETASIRVIIVAVLLAAGVLSYGDFGQYILNWSFLSMGLRGAVAFVPIMTAMFLPGRIKPVYVTAAIVAGPVITFIGKFALPSTVDSLFPGIAAAILIEAVGYFMSRKESR